MSHHQLTTLLDHLSTLITQGNLTTAALSRSMSDTYGGTDASGAWHWRMAYDAMEAAFVQILLRETRIRPPATHFDHIMEIATSLPTQTRRSEAQIRLQQFSTPIPYTFAASRAAAIREGDVVLEPSAGTGAMLCAPDMRRRVLYLNEIDPFRAKLLGAVYGRDVSAHDGEHIDDLLDANIAPDVILMNPPFSSSLDRSKDPHIAAKHMISAAKRLRDGGRLVAIMPMGFCRTRQSNYWNRLCEIVTPLMVLSLPGSVYRKQGTSVETQLLVCDKTQTNARCIDLEVASVRALLDVLPSELPPRSPSGPGQRGRAHKAAQSQARSNTQSQKRAKIAASRSGSQTTSANGHAPAPKTTSSIKPVAYSLRDTPLENTPVSDVYARYAPQRIEITGAQAHPTALVESIAMASVVPPAPKQETNAAPSLPQKITETGILSDAQLETIIMADTAHEIDLPGRFVLNEDKTKVERRDDDLAAQAYRQGFFLGDGTGCG